MSVVYARSVPVAGRGRPVTIEGVRAWLGDSFVVVSLAPNDEFRTGFRPCQVQQVADAFRRAAEVVRTAPPARATSADVRKEWARIGRIRYALVRAAYLLFPDVLFKEECPTTLSRRGFCVLAQRDFFDETYVTFRLASGYIIPRPRLRAVQAELMADHLEEAARKLLERSRRAT